MKAQQQWNSNWNCRHSPTSGSGSPPESSVSHNGWLQRSKQWQHWNRDIHREYHENISRTVTLKETPFVVSRKETRRDDDFDLLVEMPTIFSSAQSLRKLPDPNYESHCTPKWPGRENREGWTLLSHGCVWVWNTQENPECSPGVTSLLLSAQWHFRKHNYHSPSQSFSKLKRPSGGLYEGRQSHLFSTNCLAL